MWHGISERRVGFANLWCQIVADYKYFWVEVAEESERARFCWKLWYQDLIEGQDLLNKENRKIPGRKVFCDHGNLSQLNYFWQYSGYTGSMVATYNFISALKITLLKASCPASGSWRDCWLFLSKASVQVNRPLASRDT